MSEPRLFVSYSWTSPDHEARVLQIATDLRESGVDVVLDKWDLKEGHDAHAFMERMVTDPEMKKVILICDKAYVDKTDGRSGGVGVEAQIISGEIYDKQEQDKFVAVVVECDEEGKPYLPVYYRSRIYIDMSDPSTISENFERLLRWIYNQPFYKKPELGRKPEFLSQESGGVLLSTDSKFKRAAEAIRNKRGIALPATKEFFDLFVSEMEKARVDPNSDPFDEAVIKNIESFIPYRNQIIEIITSLLLYLDNNETRTVLHRFFEQIIPYMENPKDIRSYRERDYDNFKFINHELFLYAIALMIKLERFESAAFLMDNDYYYERRADFGRETMVSFEIFRQHIRSLPGRNKRLNLNRLSLRADLLEQRCKGVGVEFRHIMQADFVLFIHDHIARSDAHFNWFPETLLYVGRHSGPFEIFARSRSLKYFDKAKILLGVEGKEDLAPLLESFKEDKRRLPRWEFDSFDPSILLGFNEIGTKP